MPNAKPLQQSERIYCVLVPQTSGWVGLSLRQESLLDVNTMPAPVRVILNKEEDRTLKELRLATTVPQRTRDRAHIIWWNLSPTLAPPVELPGGGKDLYIQQDKFHMQFSADVPVNDAQLMASTQLP